MSNLELEQFLRAADAVTARYASDEDAARKYLQDSGIINEDGALTEEYAVAEPIAA